MGPNLGESEKIVNFPNISDQIESKFEHAHRSRGFIIDPFCPLQGNNLKLIMWDAYIGHSHSYSFICARVAKDRVCTANGSWTGSPPTNPRELPNGDCLPAGVKTWDSGTILNRNGKRFMLYLMPPTSGFSYNQAGSQRYQAVCQGAGLRTVGNGYSSYANNCQGAGGGHGPEQD